MGVLSTVWYNRTNLEKCFILMLIILIPLVLLMIGIYLFCFFNQEFVNANIKTKLDNKVKTYYDNINKFVIISQDTNPVLSKQKRSIYFCECSNFNCTKSFEPYKFVTSISEPIFLDCPEAFKYKSTAALLTKDYILTSADLDTNSTYQTRSSSEFWSRDGYIREINHIKKINKMLKIAKLSSPLPNDNISIQLIDISEPSQFNKIKQIDIYRWSTETTLEKPRKKYDKLNQIRLNVSTCSNPINFDGFCAFESKELSSNEIDLIYQINTNKLLGYEVTRLIKNNYIEHYYSYIGKNEIFLHLF